MRKKCARNACQTAFFECAIEAPGFRIGIEKRLGNAFKRAASVKDFAEIRRIDGGTEKRGIDRLEGAVFK